MSEKPLGPEHYVDGQFWADDVAAVIEQTGLHSTVLVAWSYGGFIITDYVRSYGEAGIAGINLAGRAVLLKPPTFDHIGPGFLENAEGACSPDLGTSVAAVRRFLRACTAEPLSDEDWHTIKQHPVEGAKLTEPLQAWLGSWATAVAQHH